MLLKPLVVVIATTLLLNSPIVVVDASQEGKRGNFPHLRGLTADLPPCPNADDVWFYKDGSSTAECRNDDKLDCSLVRCFAGPACEPGQLAIQPNPNSGKCCDWKCIGQADKPDDHEVCGDVICKTGDVCCNESCGICTAPGEPCIQLFCL